MRSGEKNKNKNPIHEEREETTALITDIVWFGWGKEGLSWLKRRPLL
jgi:hypothetical protein